MRRASQLFPIPAGTAARRCECSATVYWIWTPTNVPVTLGISATLGDGFSGAVAPTWERAGKGYPHHLDCPRARRPR